MVKSILEDGRDIRQIELVAGKELRRYTVDDDEDTIFTRIEPYFENGEMAPVVWFAVYTGGEEPIERLHSRYVSSVIYFKD